MSSELAREKMWARIHLIPLLQAEEDRDQVRRYIADMKREKELLGGNAQVYHGDKCVSVSALGCTCTDFYRFVRPTYAVTPSQVTK